MQTSTASTKRTRCLTTLVLGLSLFLPGCSIFSGLFQEDVVVMHPDAPMLITARTRGAVKVSIYDREHNRLVEYGWVEVPVGWTLHKYDWEAYILKQKADLEGGGPQP